VLKKAIWLFILVFCLAPVLTPGCSGGTDYSATVEQITELIEQRMQENEVTGLSIALVDGQDVVWTRGFGYADKENGIEATAETIYEIGSVSKLITATAVMHAQDNGLLDIDSPLVEYLPEFSILPPLGFEPQMDNPITVRTMLTHHSGIPGNFLNGDLTIEPRTDYDALLLNYLHGDYACYPPILSGPTLIPPTAFLPTSWHQPPARVGRSIPTRCSRPWECTKPLITPTSLF